MSTGGEGRRFASCRPSCPPAPRMTIFIPLLLSEVVQKRKPTARRRGAIARYWGLSLFDFQRQGVVALRDLEFLRLLFVGVFVPHVDGILFVDRHVGDR